jgi:predicted MFS family arabinose efflux permease
MLSLVATWKNLLPHGPGREWPAFAVPHGKVLLLGCFCFVLFLAEGSAMDWSAVFLNVVRGVSVAHAGVAYVVFSAAMTVCRLIGDPIVRLMGPARIVFLGCLLAAGGLLLAICVPSIAAAVIGYGLLGVGASNVVPVLFSAAGRQSSMPAHLALPAMATIAYAGNLVGPALIGFVANAFGLKTGLAVVAMLLAIVAALSTQADP